MAKQQEIKDELGSTSTVTEVSKRSAEMWRNLPAEERAYWDDVATKDKQRYMAEKASYTGPWQVPWKRAKKDPSAPKRPMSAFLYFSQERRRIIKDKNPGMRNTEVSRVLGDMWRNAPEEERNPHIEREAREREKYKVAIAKWREEHEAKMEAQKKAQEEQRLQAGNQSMYGPSAGPGSEPMQHPHGGMPFGGPDVPQSGMHQQQPPPYMYPSGHYGYPMQQPSYPPPQGGHQGGYQHPPNMMYPPYYQGYQGSPQGGQQAMVLGPNGQPQHQMPPYGGHSNMGNYSQGSYSPSGGYQQQPPPQESGPPPNEGGYSYLPPSPQHQNDDYEPQDPNAPMDPYQGGYGYSFDMDYQTGISPPSPRG